jgi:hypothetical protein
MMHRALPLAIALLLAAPLVAHADDEATIKTAAMTTGTDACKAITALPDGPTDAKCKKVTKKKVKGVGTATLYALIDSSSNWTRYAIAITAADGSMQISSSLDYMEDCAMGGKCEAVKKLTPKLRAIQVNGLPAVALDVDARMSHEQTDIDTGKHATSTAYHLRGFVACGKSTAGAWTCATASFGGYDNPCTASLSNDGDVTYTCPVTEAMSFGN